MKTRFFRHFKRFIPVLFMAALLFTPLAGSAAAARPAPPQALPDGGNGTPASPYIITTAAELDALRANPGVYYKLGNDINLTAYLASGGAGYAKWGGAGWQAIGNFSGSFEGAGYRISGLWANRPEESCVALFGEVRGGIISNVRVDTSERGVTGGTSVAVLAGKLSENGTVQLCSVAGAVTGKVENAGGLVGELRASDGNTLIRDCVSSVFVIGVNNVGGVAGMVEKGTLQDCAGSGEIFGDKYLGGVVGYLDQGTVEYCYNTGPVNGRWAKVLSKYFKVDSNTGITLGGVVGINSGGTVRESFNTAEIIGIRFVGGVAGSDIYGGKIEYCYNVGDIWGVGDTGGLVGRMQQGALLSNSYSSANVHIIFEDSFTKHSVDYIVGYVSYSTVIDTFYNNDKAKSLPPKDWAVNANGIGNQTQWSFTDGIALPVPIIPVPTYWSEDYKKSYLKNVDGWGNKDCLAWDMLSNGKFKAFDKNKWFKRGYTTASCCGKKNVANHTVERYPELKHFGESSNERYWAISMQSSLGKLDGDMAVAFNMSNNNLTVSSGYFTSGSGTYNDPYRISTPEQLNHLRAHAGSQIWVKQVADIRFPSGRAWYDGTSFVDRRNWQPIGNAAQAFNGGYLGDRHTVSGLRIERYREDNIGLFGNSSGQIFDVNVLGDEISGQSQVGGVVGRNLGGNVFRCSYAGAPVYGYGSAAGGIVGKNEGASALVQDCVHLSGNMWTQVSNVGGVVGFNNYGSVKNCVNLDGTVYSYGNSTALGGVVGYNDGDGQIINCENHARNVNGNYGGSAPHTGGILGVNYGTVENCRNYGAVIGSNHTGGIVGLNHARVRNCENAGGALVDAQSLGGAVGGIVGYNNGDGVAGIISGCQNRGAVRTGGSNYQIGGIAGYNNLGSLESCENSGAICGAGTPSNSFTGGVAGYSLGNANRRGLISKAANTGAVNAVADNVGGICGGITSSNIEQSCNSGAVSGKNSVGGLAGSVFGSGSISACYNIAPVTGAQNTGGLAGYSDGAISACFNNGSISGTWDVGGVTGCNAQGSVSACYNRGRVQGKPEGWSLMGTGGIAGANGGSLSACYNAGKVSAGGGSLIGSNRVYVGVNGRVEDCYYDYRQNSGLPDIQSYGENLPRPPVGLSTLAMADDDYWQNEQIMPGLKADFVKRAGDAEALYYPELAVFYNGTAAQQAASLQSAAITGAYIEVGYIIQPAAIYPGQQLALIAPYISSGGDSAGWEIRPPGGAAWSDYDNTPLGLEHDGWLLRYCVKMSAWDFVSNEVPLIVRKDQSAIALSAGVNAANNIVLTAELSTCDAEERWVDFYVDGTLVGSQRTSGQVASYTLSSVAGVSYDLKAEFAGDSRTYGSVNEIAGFSVEKQNQDLYFVSHSGLLYARISDQYIDLPQLSPNYSSGALLCYSDNESVATMTNVNRIDLHAAGTANIRLQRQGDHNFNDSNGLLLQLVVEKAIHPESGGPGTLYAVYGQTLADIDLPARFSWSDPLDTPVGVPGRKVFTLTYTPQDTDYYQIQTGIVVAVIVERVRPQIIAPPVTSSVLAGRPLNQVDIIGGLADVPGTFSWLDHNRLAAASGNEIMFSPDDPNYEYVIFTVDIELYDLTPYWELNNSVTGLINAAAVGEGHNQIPWEARDELLAAQADIYERVYITSPYLTLRPNLNQRLLDEAYDSLAEAIAKFYDSVLVLDTGLLDDLIAEARALLSDAVVGDRNGQYPQYTYDDLAWSLSIAESFVLENGTARPQLESLMEILAWRINDFRRSRFTFSDYVESVAVVPAAAQVQKGGTQQFYAEVEAYGTITTEVTWSVAGGGAGTSITASGLLTVAAGETAAALTVSALSHYDDILCGTASVTVTGGPPPAAVLAVLISPPTTPVLMGGTQQFTARVAVQGGAAPAVKWSVSDNSDSATRIDENSGLLQVGAEETSAILNVSATAVADAACRGAATAYVFPPDTLPPTGQISIGEREWDSFCTNSAFERFLRDEQAVGIWNVADNWGGAVTVEYCVAGAALSEEELALTGWTAYNGAFMLYPGKYIIYARLTDERGNSGVICTDGLVIFNDSAAGTAAIAYATGSRQDKSASVILNGNTVAAVEIGADTLMPGRDYTAAGNTITFKGSWLETLAASPAPYTLTVYYNPQGVEYVDNEEQDAPATTTILLTVDGLPGHGVTVSGLLKSYNPRHETTLQLWRAGEAEAAHTCVIQEENSGSGLREQPFAFYGVEPATYTLIIRKKAHTSFTVRNIAVAGGDVDLTQDSRPAVQLMTLRCGDINGDGNINNSDLTILSRQANYNRSATAADEPLCDLNGDGLINNIDLTILWLAYNYNRGAVEIE
jgi:hypothetical protein